MRSYILILAVVGLASPLWAADPKAPAEPASPAPAPKLVELKSAKITFLGQGNALISASGQAVKQGDSLAEKRTWKRAPFR